MNLRTLAFATLATVAFGTSAVSFAQTTPGPQGTPPPPPVPSVTSSPLISTSPEPTPTPTPEPFGSPSAEPAASPSPAGGRRRHRGGANSAPTPEASPSETPEPPQFSTLDGVWEVAFQPLNGARTTYSHLYVKQDGNTLTGTWRRGGGKKASLVPFTGTFDGRLFKLTVTDDAGTATLSGYAENYSDMVGLYSDSDPKHIGTPFTAAHRKSARERERDADEKPERPNTTGRPPQP